MEKFYIVTNEKFLKEIDEWKINDEIRNSFIKDFFYRNDICGMKYCLCGTGGVNSPFTEKEKKNIHLYIEDCKENNNKFERQLLKGAHFGDDFLRRFRNGCALIKKFQDECVEKHIVINLRFHSEGDYFKELHLGGYTVTRFQFDGNYYLKIETNKYDSITSEFDGFSEINGSEFYLALERCVDNKQ